MMKKKEKSPMELWAENEVRLACERERAGAPENDWDYGVACYRSALKAFKSLLEDEHSGMSISFTKGILNRLIDGKPLTPIEDTEYMWEEIPHYEEGIRLYRCKRMSSLFKEVYGDGRVEYNDVKRFLCMNVNNEGVYFRNGFVSNTLGEMFPVKFPYIAKRYIVHCLELLTDRRNGDFDSLAILFVEDEDGNVFDVYKYYKETEDSFAEISESEWKTRELWHSIREQAERTKQG